MNAGSLSKSNNKKIIIEDRSWSLIFNNFMHELNQLVEFDSGSLFLFEGETNTLKEVATIGDGIDFISKVNFPMGNGLSAWVAQKGKIIYLPDIHRGSRHGLNPIRSYLSMPLEIYSKVIGVLNLGHVVPDAFGDNKMTKIQNLTREMSRKIYNRRYLNYITNEQENFTY